MLDADENPQGDAHWDRIENDTLGWCTNLRGSRHPTITMVLAMGDVFAAKRKGVDDTRWPEKPLITPGKVPADLTDTYVAGGGEVVVGGRPGVVDGTYDGDFGGTSNDVIWLVQRDRLILATDGEHFDDTCLTDMPVLANVSHTSRSFSRKGQADPVNEEAWYGCFGQHGFHGTIDQGDTPLDMSWLPAPTHPVGMPEARWGIIAIDASSSLTSGRKSRIAFSPSGKGVWLSTNGGVSGTDITGSTGIEAVSCMIWLTNGDLIVTACDKTDGSAPLDNLWRYRSGAWSRLASTINGGTPYDYVHLIADPLHTGGFFAVRPSSDFIRTLDGTNFLTFIYNYSTAMTMTQMRAGEAPGVADKFRNAGHGWAISRGEVVGAKLYQPHGLGVAATVLADFPTESIAGVPDDLPFNTGWPVWKDESAGMPGIVGLSGEWFGDNAICFGQDVAIGRAELGTRGHRATVTRFPAYTLSDVSGGCYGGNGYGVARRTRLNPPQAAVPGFSFTEDDGDTWGLMAHQPAQGPAAIYESGHGICNAERVAVSLPGSYGARPQMTQDNGESPWDDIRWWIDDTELEFNEDDPHDYHGFQGGDFSKCHHLGCWDEASRAFYFWNLGATANELVTPWTSDPRGWGGIYRMAEDDYPNARRIHAGLVAATGNRGYYDAKVLADGNGHLILMPNHLPFPALDQTNKTVIYDIDADTITPINDVLNCHSITFGPKLLETDDHPTLFAVAWSKSPGNQYGLYYSRHLGADGSWKGPFNMVMPQGGYVNYISAHRSIWGFFIAAVQSTGHAIGRWRHGGT